MKEMPTQQQKDRLFETIVLNNLPNLFVYNQLRQTLMDNPSVMIPFVGAGLSQFYYNAWGKLLSELLDQLADQEHDAEKIAQIQEEIKNWNFFKAADDLESLVESDVFYFAVVSAYNESKLITKGIPDDAAVKWLPKIFTNPRIITTNYDCVLKFAYAQEKKYLRVCTPSDSRMFMQSMPRRLFKIHGSYDSNYEDIVLTSKSYEEKYAKESLLYNNFKHIVQSNILFFLGASLRSDKTLDILKESAEELSVSGHYCGNMHYAILHIDNDDDKTQRRRDMAEYKILPILYSDKDHDEFEDKHMIVSVILEKLYGEVSKQIEKETPSGANGEQFIEKSPAAADVKNAETRNTRADGASYNGPFPKDNNRGDELALTRLMRQDPLKAFTKALSNNNLSWAEAALSTLEYSVPYEIYLTKILTALASRGSTKAATQLFDVCDELMDGGYSSAQIIDIAGSLVSYCNRQDKELDYREKLEALLSSATEGATPQEEASIYNQFSRLYYGIFVSNDQERKYRDLAKQYLDQAISCNDQEPSFFYNLAVIEKEDDPQAACRAIEKCLALNTKDVNHLTLAFKLYKKTKDPRADEVLEKIREKDPTTAQFLLEDDDT